MVDADEADHEATPTPHPRIANPPPAAAIDAFFRAHWQGLVAGLIREGATGWEAQDAVANAIRDALRRWDHIADPVNRIRSTARAYWHAHRLGGEATGREVLVADVTTVVGRHRDDPATADDAELSVYEIQEWLDGVVSQLPPARQQVLRLAARGLTPMEIAARVGKSPEAIRTALRLGRRQARALRAAQPSSPPERTTAPGPAPDAERRP